MANKIYSHKISPQNILRGGDAWEKAKHLIPDICKRPLLIGRSKETYPIRERLKEDLSLYK